MAGVVALIDYGSGNLRSAEKALCRAADGLGPSTRVEVTDDPEVIARADRIVLPGVGAFAACKAALDARHGVVEALTEAVCERGAPFLGICVGMQLLATRGLEFGETAGLGWVSGDVERLKPAGFHAKIPHMGWNALEGADGSALLCGLEHDVHMYFTHSYAFVADNPQDVSAWTDHGGRFAAAVTHGNVAGVQFHPEKSQGAGARLLRNFLEWRP
jgi:imidazole glycerol-phosphate synthase subunit HisH